MDFISVCVEEVGHHAHLHGASSFGKNQRFAPLTCTSAGVGPNPTCRWMGLDQNDSPPILRIKNAYLTVFFDPGNKIIDVWCL